MKTKPCAWASALVSTGRSKLCEKLSRMIMSHVSWERSARNLLTHSCPLLSMAIHIALNHRTRYDYDRPVTLGPQIVRLRPAPHCRTRILSYSLRVTPEKHFINWMQDPQSNYAARLVFDKPTRELCVEVDLIAEMSVLNPFDFFLEPQAEK